MKALMTTTLLFTMSAFATLPQEISPSLFRKDYVFSCEVSIKNSATQDVLSQSIIRSDGHFHFGYSFNSEKDALTGQYLAPVGTPVLVSESKEVGIVKSFGIGASDSAKGHTGITDVSLYRRTGLKKDIYEDEKATTPSKTDTLIGKFEKIKVTKKPGEMPKVFQQTKTMDIYDVTLTCVLN